MCGSIFSVYYIRSGQETNPIYFIYVQKVFKNGGIWFFLQVWGMSFGFVYAAGAVWLRERAP